MYPFKFLKAIFNPKNFLMLLYVLASNLIIFVIGNIFGKLFYQSLHVSSVKFFVNILKVPFDKLPNGFFSTTGIFLGLMFLIANLVLTFLMASILGEFFIRHLSFRRTFKCNPDKDLTPESIRIYKIFLEVYEEAKQKNNKIVNNIRLFISDDLSINACIIGVKTMVINKGVLPLTDQQIKGIIAHELGHSTHSDALLSFAKFISNGIISIFVSIIKILATLIIILAPSEDGDHPIIGFFIKIIMTVFVRWIISALFFIWMMLGHYIEMANSRSHEYEADKFALELGYGHELIEALSIIDSSSARKKEGFSFNSLLRTHPYTRDRIDRLTELLPEGKKLENATSKMYMRKLQK